MSSLIFGKARLIKSVGIINQISRKISFGRIRCYLSNRIHLTIWVSIGYALRAFNLPGQDGGKEGGAALEEIASSPLLPQEQSGTMRGSSQ